MSVADAGAGRTEVLVSNIGFMKRTYIEKPFL